MTLLNKNLFKYFYFLVIIFLFFSCKYIRINDPLSNYNELNNIVQISAPTEKQRLKFNINSQSEKITIAKENNKTVTGYPTNNKEFFDEIIMPIIKNNLSSLSEKNPVELINSLTLFIYQVYRVYFGVDMKSGGFYRWGGDIFDLDDPQKEGIRHDKKYGLDCSGFVSAAFETAVYFGLIKSDDDAAVISSQGFQLYCLKNNITDRGGIDGTSNRFRVDSSEMMKLGREIFAVPKNHSPKKEDISKLQPGDIVGRPGHVGIVVDIKGTLYYLESGGWVVPLNKGVPVLIAKAITIFAKGGPVYVRRVLPDYKN